MNIVKFAVTFLILITSLTLEASRGQFVSGDWDGKYFNFSTSQTGVMGNWGGRDFSLNFLSFGRGKRVTSFDGKVDLRIESDQMGVRVEGKVDGCRISLDLFSTMVNGDRCGSSLSARFDDVRAAKEGFSLGLVKLIFKSYPAFSGQILGDAILRM